MNTTLKTSIFTAALVLSVLPLSAKTLSELANEGDKAYTAGDFAKAAELYEKAQVLDSDNIDYTTAYNLGMTYDQLQDSEKALNSYKNSFLKGNDDRSIFNKMKVAATAMKCNDCLVTAYREIEEKVPYLKGAINEKLFFVYASQQKTKEAIASCYAVLEENPENYQIVKNLGMTYTGISNRLDSAVFYLDKAYEMRPEDAAVNKALGICYNTMYENKIAYENKAYEKSNKDRSSYNAMMFNRQAAARNFYPKAIKHIDAANQTMNDPELTKLSARLKEALKAYQK